MNVDSNLSRKLFFNQKSVLKIQNLTDIYIYKHSRVLIFATRSIGRDFFKNGGLEIELQGAVFIKHQVCSKIEHRISTVISVSFLAPQDI